MKKNLKITLLSSMLLSLVVSIGCIPQALDLPLGVGQTASPNGRTDLCGLLLTVGGNQADVDRCLTATSLSQADKDRICALSGNLTDTQKAILRANLGLVGINEAQCPIISTTTGTTTGSTTGSTTGTTTGDTTGSTTGNTSTPQPTVATSEPTAFPTSSPTPSNAPIPSSSPTAGNGGGGGGGGSQGCGSGTCSGDSGPNGGGR